MATPAPQYRWSKDKHIKLVNIVGADTKYQVDQTQSTRFEVSDLDQNKCKTSFEVEPDTEPLILTTFGNIQALLDSEDELNDESNEEMYEAKEEMDYEIQQPANEETHPPHSTDPKPTKDEYSTKQPIPELSMDQSLFLHVSQTLPQRQQINLRTQEKKRSLDFKMFKNNVPTTKRVLVKNLQNFSSFLYAHLSEDNWVKHEESIASYADLRVAVEGFTIEADNNRNNYDIVINNVMESVEKINGARIKERTTLLKALNRVSKTLEVDSALKASKQKMEDTNTNTSSNITNLTVLLRDVKFPEIITQLNSF
ncbi:hypothetical protein Tco_1447084 [Tanacetum coccineum]